MHLSCCPSKEMHNDVYPGFLDGDLAGVLNCLQNPVSTSGRMNEHTSNGGEGVSGYRVLSLSQAAGGWLYTFYPPLPTPATAAIWT